MKVVYKEKKMQKCFQHSPQTSSPVLGRLHFNLTHLNACCEEQCEIVHHSPGEGVPFEKVITAKISLSLWNAEVTKPITVIVNPKSTRDVFANKVCATYGIFTSLQQKFSVSHGLAISEAFQFDASLYNVFLLILLKTQPAPS